MIIRVVIGADGAAAHFEFRYGDGHGDLLGGGHGDGRMFDESGNAVVAYGAGDDHGHGNGYGHGHDETGGGEGGMENHNDDFIY